MNKEYREGLQETFEINFSSETIAGMSAALLLRNNIYEILLAVGRRISDEQDTLGRQFENFPLFMMAKSVVWTDEFNIDYLFMLYLLFNDEVGFYSIYSGFFEWDAISDERKIFILNRLQNKFDLKTGLLQREFVEQYTEYGILLKHQLPCFGV